MAAEASFVIRAVDATRAAFASVQNTLQKTAAIAKTMGTTIRNALGNFGIAFGSAAILGFTKSLIDLGGYINDTARAAGLSTDAFQALSYAAQESGVGMEQIARASEALRSKIADAASGNEAAVKTFEKLGLTGQELKAISLDKAWEVIAKAVKSAKDEQEAMNAVSDIFGGRIGPKLREVIDTLSQGSIEKLSEQMKGITLTKDQLDALDAAGDKLERIWTTIKVISAKGFLALTQNVDFGKANFGSAFFGMGGLGQNPLFGKKTTDETNKQTAAVKAGVAAIDDATLAAMAAAKAEEELAAEYKFRQELSYNGEDRTARLAKAAEEMQAFRNKQFEEGQKLIEAARTPLQKYNDEIERLSKLEEAGVITTDAAAAAMGKAAIEFVNAGDALDDYTTRQQKAIEEAGKLEFQFTKIELVANRAGEMIASSFEDAVFAGQKLGEVLKSLARDLVRLVFQQTITAPLAGAISGLIRAGFRADGGPVSSGMPYVVGERGPELFVPRTSGAIVPNHAMGGGSGYGGVNITYNIAAGVTQAELTPILEAERRRLKAEIPDMVRRGGAYRAAFA